MGGVCNAERRSFLRPFPSVPFGLPQGLTGGFGNSGRNPKPPMACLGNLFSEKMGGQGIGRLNWDAASVIFMPIKWGKASA
jgi:hypothetical protein